MLKAGRSRSQTHIRSSNTEHRIYTKTEPNVKSTEVRKFLEPSFGSLFFKFYQNAGRETDVVLLSERDQGQLRTVYYEQHNLRSKSIPVCVEKCKRNKSRARFFFRSINGTRREGNIVTYQKRKLKLPKCCGYIKICKSIIVSVDERAKRTYY